MLTETGLFIISIPFFLVALLFQIKKKQPAEFI